MVDTSLLGDRYRLERKLATGGMGSVYEATDERLERLVAVKLLKEELVGDPRFVERFRREARSVAALSHPNIASVFDYGQDGSRHFIVMELAEGKDLARVLREEGPMSAERVVRIGSQICDALAHAHAAGVVHRDVKPANIIVGPSDRVKVTDFGIARAAGDSTMTATGSMLGTAHYLSPEQANGLKVGPASDIYSLGVVLYEMLTGALPFTADSPVAVAMRHISDDLPPPSATNPAVSPEMDAVVARATAKDPALRYRDAGALRAALEECISAAATEPLGAGLVDTMVDTMVERGPATSSDGSAPTVWPIPGDRWDPNRIGRAVLVIFAALLVIVVLLLIFNVFGGSPTPAARHRKGAGAAAGTARSEAVSPDGITIPADIAQRSLPDAEQALIKLGLLPHTVPATDTAGAPGTIVGVSPSPGVTAAPGSVVTLQVIPGPGHGKDHGHKEPPGHAKKHKEGD